MRRGPAVAAALLLLALLLLAVGPRAVAVELAGASPGPLVAGAAGSLAALGAWSEAQRRLHRAAGARVPPGRFLRAYLVGVFGKQVVPGGQIAGPAVVAFAVGRETDLAYEQDLAATTVGKLLGTLAAVVPAAVGLAVVAVPAQVARPAVLGVTVAALAVLGMVAVARARPDDLAALLRRAGAVVHGTLGRFSTRIRERTAPPEVDAVVARGRRTFGAVGDDRRGVAVAFALSVVGWTCYAVPLWGAAVSVDIPLAPGAALFVAPVASLGTLVPLPSGAGGVDLVVGGLLVAIAGAPVPVVAATVLLYRVLVDVLPALAGAVAGATYLG